MVVVFGLFEAQDVIGRGGRGRVHAHRGYDAVRQRTAAHKPLPLELASFGACVLHHHRNSGRRGRATR
jgi:hypothetical protein